MFLRVAEPQIELPAPEPQDTLAGKYGEMSTLGNYLFQSVNFRSKNKLRPYSLVGAITAEEFRHVELVSNGFAMLNNGPDTDESNLRRHPWRAVRRHGRHSPRRWLLRPFRRRYVGERQQRLTKAAR